MRQSILVLALACAVLTTGSPILADDPPDARAAADALLAAEKWDEAAAAYAKLTETQPEDVTLWSSLGRARREARRLDEALSAYEKGLEASPGDLRSLVGLAATLELRGEVDAALERVGAAVDGGLPSGVLLQNPVFERLRTHEGFAAIVEKAKRAETPCLGGAPWDDFDFWVGTWDVYVGGQTQSQNTITKDLDGCMVRERYSTNFGYRGESYNFVDPATRKWRQLWLDARGGVVRYEGGLESEGVMVMEGTNTDSKGQVKRARVRWERLEEGRVHHKIEVSDDDGATWTVGFEAIYVPAGSPAP